MQRIILLTGIHGVGKGYIGDKITEKLKIPVHSASTLIKMYNAKTYDNKIVDEIEKNQELLIKCIKENINDQLFILDSHTCLLAANNKITNISIKWFKQMNIVGIIVLCDNLEKIKDRLYQRDNLNFEISFLEKFQNQEIKSSINLAKKINVPFIRFQNSNNVEALINFLKSFI